MRWSGLCGAVCGQAAEYATAPLPRFERLRSCWLALIAAARQRHQPEGAVVGKASGQRLAIPALFSLLMLVALFAWWVHRSSRVRWARDQAVPQIAHLIEEEKVRRGLYSRSAG